MQSESRCQPEPWLTSELGLPSSNPVPNQSIVRNPESFELFGSVGRLNYVNRIIDGRACLLGLGSQVRFASFHVYRNRNVLVRDQHLRLIFSVAVGATHCEIVEPSWP